MSGQRCTKCGAAITPGQMFLNALGRTWHHNCFTCKGCNTSLGTSEFFPLNNEPFCARCHATHEVPSCASCGQPVRRGTDFLRYDNKCFHSSCFMCNSCGTELRTADFFIHDGKRYCHNCSNKLTVGTKPSSYNGMHNQNRQSSSLGTGGGGYNTGSGPTYSSGYGEATSSYGPAGVGTYHTGRSTYNPAPSYNSSTTNNESRSDRVNSGVDSIYGSGGARGDSIYGYSAGSDPRGYSAGAETSTYGIDHKVQSPEHDQPFSAEITIGVTPTNDVKFAERKNPSTVDDDHDLNALVAELETSGSQFNSRYGVSSQDGHSEHDHRAHHDHEHHGYSDNEDQPDDPLAAALASLENLDEHT